MNKCAASAFVFVFTFIGCISMEIFSDGAGLCWLLVLISLFIFNDTTNEE